MQRLECLKKELRSEKRFKVKRCFRALDTGRNGWFDRNSLGAFMSKAKVRLSKDLLKSCMRRLDLNGDYRVSLAEFYDALSVYKPPAPVHQIKQVTFAKNTIAEEPSTVCMQEL